MLQIREQRSGNIPIIVDLNRHSRISIHRTAGSISGKTKPIPRKKKNNNYFTGLTWNPGKAKMDCPKDRTSTNKFLFGIEQE